MSACRFFGLRSWVYCIVMLPDPTLNMNAVMLREGFLRDHCLGPWRKYMVIDYRSRGSWPDDDVEHTSLWLASLSHDTQTSSPRQCSTIAVDILLIPWTMNVRPLFATMVLSFNLLYKAASYVLHLFSGRYIREVTSNKLPHSC